jgi:hypothetical protein
MVVGIAALAAADLALFALRLRSLLEDGTLAVTTGLEEPIIRHVWLARLGLPVYAPADGAGSLPPYNWLFYSSFGHVARLFEDGPASILRFGRLFNGLLVAAGAAVHFLLARFVLRTCGLRLPAAAVAAIVLPCWIGSGLIRWFALSVRPDGAALLFATLGMLLYARGVTRTGPAALATVAGASLAFHGAWAFKQSVVLLLAGCLVDAALSRRPARLAALAVPFAVLTAATFAALGGEYAHLLLAGPTVSPLSAGQAAFVLPRALLPPLLYWAVPAAWLRSRRRGAPDAGPAPHLVRWLARCAAVSFAGACALSLKQGSYVYYFWEAMIACGVLLCAALAAPARGRLFRAACAGGLAVTLASSAVQLAAPGRTSRIDLLTDAQAAALRERIRAVRELPVPLFCEDRLLALPWYGGRGDPAAQIFDPNLGKAARIGEFVGEGVGGRLRRGEFASAVLGGRDRFGFVADADAAGMRRADVPALTEAGLIVYVRR